MNSNAVFGFVVMLIAALSYGGVDVAAKVLGENLSPWQMTSGRAALGIIAALVWSRFQLRSFLISDWGWQVAIGLSSTCGFVSLLYAIKFLPLSVALPLSYLYPALGALMSPLINREKPTKTDWLAIILAFAGVCLLGHSTAENKAVTWVGLAWAMGASFWLALMSNLTRRQAKAKPGYVIVFYLFLVNLAVCLPVSMIIDQPVAVASKDFFYLAGILSPLAVLAIICMSIGFKHLSAHRGGVILTMEAVTAALFGLIFLHEPLTLYVGIGGLLLVVSAGIIAASKQK